MYTNFHLLYTYVKNEKNSFRHYYMFKLHFLILFNLIKFFKSQRPNFIFIPSTKLPVKVDKNSDFIGGFFEDGTKNENVI